MIKDATPPALRCILAISGRPIGRPARDSSGHFSDFWLTFASSSATTASSASSFSWIFSRSRVDGRFIAESAALTLLSRVPLADSVLETMVWIPATNSLVRHQLLHELADALFAGGDELLHHGVVLEHGRRCCVRQRCVSMCEALVVENSSTSAW